jgi:hypothetical protein
MDLEGGGAEAWKSPPQGHAWDCGYGHVPGAGGAFVYNIHWMIAPAKALRTALPGLQLQLMA